MTLADWQSRCLATIGRSRTVSDSLQAERAGLMELCLDREPDLQHGDALPPLWHWTYFIEPVPTSELGPDGHERLGRFLPPIRYPRRMWAGGDVTFRAPLIIGRQAEKTTSIDNVAFKRGRSGPLCFVTVRHRIRQDGREAIDEVQTIVYRDRSDGEEPPRRDDPPAKADGFMSVGRLQMFRYSALTFNAHRIHYDEKFAVETEGYPGLIVHGPLLASTLVSHGSALEPRRPLGRFRYRALLPVFEDEPFRVDSQRAKTGAELRIVKPQAGMAMQATLEWA